MEFSMILMRHSYLGDLQSIKSNQHVHLLGVLLGSKYVFEEVTNRVHQKYGVHFAEEQQN